MRGLVVLLVVALAAAAWADGGMVRLSQTSGRFTITVFSAPTPLRAGAIDLSVLVQTAPGGAPLLDASVSVALRPGNDPARELTAVATHEAATNQLLYAALLRLPTPGLWSVEVRVDAERVRFEMEAAPALPDALTFWPYLALPFAALAVFGLHQWLVLRRVDHQDTKTPRTFE